MMIALSIVSLIAIAAIATGLSLLDSWLRGVGAYRVIKRERALLDAGFIPQVHAHEVRLRAPQRRTLAAATRPYARRVPLPVTRTAA